MDDQPQPQQPAAPSATPQIRSRITVVCAECKRLKLKCDRRTPCGSCTKRDTVSRCIYSPAAAEKVDLHSLNNRLIQVEAILAMVTAGKTPPPFQSSYPLAQVTLPTSHSTKSRATHATAASTTSSISIRLHDLTNIWLANCQLDLFAPGNQASFKLEIPSDGTYVKVEPSSTETLHLATPYHENTIIIDDGPSSRMAALSATQHNLPPLHLYYSSSVTASQQHEGQSTSYAYPTHNPYPAEFNSSFLPHRDYEFTTPQKPFAFSSTPQSTSISPAASPALLALLPPPSIRTKLLASVRAAHPHLTLLIQWARVADLADPEAASAKEKQKSLACAVFFGVRSGSHSPSSMPPSNRAGASVTLFACLCYLLALGALEPSPDASVDHAFLYALAGQAMGVWEEYRTSLEMKEAEEGKEGGEGGDDARKPKQVDNEKEDMDHLLASLLQVTYLLRAGFSVVSKELGGTLETVFPLIGKLVNVARGLGLARDPEEDMRTGSRRSTKGEERRRMIWWDIMFYDTFTSDALNHVPLITPYSYTTKIPVIARTSSGTPDTPSFKYPTPVVGGVDGDDENDSTFDTEELVSKPNTTTKPNDVTKGRAASRIPAPKGKTKLKVTSTVPMADDADNGFFRVRCRLTRLAQTVQHRLSHPGCECCTCGNGYTLDQAAKLEAEVRAWSADLPASLKLEGPHTLLEDSKPDFTKSPRHAALAAELAVLANRMIISAYVPLMRPHPEIATSSNTSASASAYSAAHPWSPASRATVDAAQGVVRAARVLQRLLQAGSGTLLSQYYPLEKAVVDALVICAHSGFATGKPRPILEEVTVALEILEAMGSGRSEGEGELGRIVASLRRRVETAEVGKRDDTSLKRKHHMLECGAQGEQDGETGPRLDRMGFAVDLGNMYGKMDDTDNENILSTSPQQHRLVTQPPTPQRISSVPRSRAGDKRYARKGSATHPSFGVRDRGKEGAPWMVKRSSMTPPKSDCIPEPRLTDLTPADGSMNFQPLQLPPSQNGSGPPMSDTGYRSRSSSTTQAPRMQAVEHAMQYGGAEERHSDTHTSQRRRFSIHDHRHPAQQQQQQQQQLEQGQVRPFSMSPAVYNTNQQLSRAGSFDAPRGFDQHGGSFDQPAVDGESAYGGEPSSYPNSTASHSTASSPFGSASGHPQTPTYASSSHHSSPPTFGPQPTTTSPQTYFHIPSSFEAPYDGHGTQQQPRQVMGGIPMDTSMPGQSQPRNGMGVPSTVVPSTPIYEENQPLIYDHKPSANLAQQQQQQQLQAMQHYQVVGGGRATPVEGQHHVSMNPSSHQTWAPTPQYMQSQPVADQNDEQYWNTSAYYRPRVM